MPNISNIVPELGGLIRIWDIVEEESDFGAIHRPDIAKEIARYQSPLRRKQILCVREILKEENCFEELHYLDSGKPILESRGISISHSKSLLAVYLSKHLSIGVDLEHFSDKVLRVAKRFMNEHEQNDYGISDRLTCTLIWSAKEAIFKKHGGQTTYFSSQQRVTEINRQTQKMTVKLIFNDTAVYEQLSYQIFDEFVLVYTSEM